MRAPSAGALVVLASLCFGEALASTDKAKFKEACPAYEHYARFAQYETVFHVSRVPL